MSPPRRSLVAILRHRFARVRICRLAAIALFATFAWSFNQPVLALNPLTGVGRVVAGNWHTCAITITGGVKCWGQNDKGQLGDNSLSQRLTAVDVAGLEGGVAAVAAGLKHTCALLSDGQVSCWGDNQDGQLGDSTNTTRLTPVSVGGLDRNVGAIAAGGSHTCSLNSSGGVACWGNNQYGQLGDGSTTTRTAPIGVQGLSSGIRAITLGYNHTCALTMGGAVKCWGSNSSGQIGDNTTTQRETPFDVMGLAGSVISITAGAYHTCVLSTGGGAKCWGSNNDGQLGDNSQTDRLSPRDVSGLDAGLIAITAGIFHTCALTSAGRAKCWGYNAFGQLGDGTVTDRRVPVDVQTQLLGSTVPELTAEGFHSCARTVNGEVMCWGYNTYGQLGDNSRIDRRSPVSVLVAQAQGPLSTPGAPSISSVSPGNAQATVTFAPPASDGGSPINTYTVQSSPDSKTASGGGVYPLTVIGLRNGAPYTFTVTATNAVGSGPPSAASNAVIPTLTANFQGLWWKSPANSESGWGLNVAHQGEILFATWFTYDADGAGMWLVMSDGRLVGPNTFTGAVYRTTGPPLHSAPFEVSRVVATQVGSATLTFSNSDSGIFQYTVNGITQSKPIVKQTFATPAPVCSTESAGVVSNNFQDLWWRSPAGSEPGWGVNIAHQGDVLFATLFSYAEDGRGMWLVMSDGRMTGTNSYTGTLFRTRGPAFSASPWNPAGVTVTAAGTATFVFSDRNTGTFSYTVDGISRSKPITRQVFASPSTICR